ncbi:hypothetical protein D9619_012332 [Psilocybe cf. subviscida]|uniref:Uncharacterized protein n=1 Tax=Psilocybe cf. subviscida TaxID=2480587 RepID=A0A8H5ER60_9AGAR|nr:hypothetical protein D9619_012332 [Psilocybe cf. subviscida]
MNSEPLRRLAKQLLRRLSSSSSLLSSSSRLGEVTHWTPITLSPPDGDAPTSFFVFEQRSCLLFSLHCLRLLLIHPFVTPHTPSRRTTDFPSSRRQGRPCPPSWSPSSETTILRCHTSQESAKRPQKFRETPFYPQQAFSGHSKHSMPTHISLNIIRPTAREGVVMRKAASKFSALSTWSMSRLTLSNDANIEVGFGPPVGFASACRWGQPACFRIETLSLDHTSVFLPISVTYASKDNIHHDGRPLGPFFVDLG